MSASALRKGHVNFGTEDISPKDNAITAKQCIPGHVYVNLGFLLFRHIYSIALELPKRYFLDYDLKSVLNAADKSLPNVNCKIVSIKERDDIYELEVQFHAMKERLHKEELMFSLEEDVKVVIEFNARVLGPGKGTPLLKNGIKCIGVDAEELSDFSDWQAD